jgi:hypothetical protein
MRTILGLLFSLMPVAAYAQPAPAPAPVPASSTDREVPAGCEGAAVVPSQMLIETPLLAAKMSTASCAALARAETLALTDDPPSVVELQNAMEPSLDAYQQLVDDPHPAWQLLAAHAHADLLLGMATRMRATIEPVPAGAVGVELIGAQSDRDARHEALEPLIRPWISAAQADLVRALSVAKQHPELAQDPVIAAAIRHAEADLAAGS